MATNNVKYVCGCGYSTKTLELAITHCDARHHTLIAQGSIQSMKEILRSNIPSGITVPDRELPFAGLRERLAGATEDD